MGDRDAERAEAIAFQSAAIGLPGGQVFALPSTVNSCDVPHASADLGMKYCKLLI